MTELDDIRPVDIPFSRSTHTWVFVTKFRHNVSTDRHPRLEEIMRAVRADVACDLVESSGEDNHVHLPVNVPPKVAVAKLVNSLKGVSSRRLRQEFPDLRRHYYRTNKVWTGSYFAGSWAAHR